MTTFSLKSDLRQEIGKQVSQLRQSGKLPAVLYGHHVKPVNLVIDYTSFEKLFKAAGESTLVDLTVNGEKPVKVLIQDYQLDPKTNQFIHVDFHQVRMDEKLRAEINLKFLNEAPAVKELGGILVTNIHELEVECLPQYLVHEIEVDLGGLKHIGDAIHVSDIVVPAGLTVHHVPTDVVVLIQEPRSEKEMAELETAPQAKLPEEVVEPEKTEEGSKAEKSEK